MNPDRHALPRRLPVVALLVLTGCGWFTEETPPPAPAPAEPPAEEVPPPEPEEAEPAEEEPPEPTARPPRRPPEVPPTRPRPEREPEPEPEHVPPEVSWSGEMARPPLVGAPVPVLVDALLPRKRIVAFYGNPASSRMGILGELPPDEMLQRLDREVRAWERADPTTPVQPALHLIASMAAADPGRDSTYLVRMPEWRIEQVKEWADSRNALLFLDIQPGRSTVQAELPRLREWLAKPDVHLALDPEWNMGPDGFPGRTIGSMTAAEINHAVRFLIGLVEEHDLPPKILVVHRFTQHMVRGAEEIIVDPRVQVVMHMDGWGHPPKKLNTYQRVVAPEAEQFTGFKLFYKNDRRDGGRLLTPEEILALTPVPFYIQYQ